MSGIFEKTLESLGSLFPSMGTDVGLKNMLQKCLSARTRKEEEWLIRDCLRHVKGKLSEPSIKPSTVTRCLAFSIFSELLGQKADFAYIDAVKLAQNGSLAEKKMGYLACAFLLRDSDPLCVLLVNTIVRDMTSKNIFIVAMALSACCHLVPADQTTVILPVLEEKLSHSNEFIRSKTVIALHNFFRISPQLCYPYINQVKVLLGDKDPGVVAYVLQFLLEVAQDSPEMIMDIIPALIQIQNQILDGKLPPEFKYRGLSAPWMQISIIRLLRYLPESSKEVFMLLQKTLESAKPNAEKAIGAAIIYECVSTLVHHKAGDELLASSLLYVADLMSSSDNDLSYAGLCLLEMVLHQYKLPLSASQQEVVLSGLRHPDEAMKRRTLHLLCTVAQAHSAQTICSQVVDYVRSECGTNSHIQHVLVEKAITLTDKFPNHQTHWHIAMLIQLLPLAQDKQARAIQRRIQLTLLSGSGGPESAAVARNKVLHILGKYSESKTVSTSVLEVYLWALSQFSSDDGKKLIEHLVLLGRKVLRNHESAHSISPSIRNLLVSLIDALSHVTEKFGMITSSLEEFLHEMMKSRIGDAYLRHICKDILSILPHITEIHQRLQRSKETDDLDFTLSFLDKYVCESLEGSALPYQPKLLHITRTPVVERTVLLTTTPNAASATSLPSQCPSPISSGTGSILDFPRSESYSSEDSRSWSLRSPRKDTMSKPLWSRQGRARVTEVQPSTFVTSDSEMQRLADILFAGEETESSRDPLDDLLHRDFQKLSVVKSERS